MELLRGGGRRGDSRIAREAVPHPAILSLAKDLALALREGLEICLPFFLFILPKRKNARPVELRAAAAVGRRREPAISAAFFRHRKAASYALALLRSLSIPPFFHSKRLSFPVENPGEFQKGLASPFWSFE